MTGGARGPIPKRSDERRRRNKPEGGEITQAPSGTPDGDEGKSPKAMEHWCPLAKNWYRSLAKSGQSAFYEPSDWATAQIVAEAIHKLFTGAFNGMAFASVMAEAGNLLTTEGQRRRLRLELKKGGEVDEGKRSDKIVSIYRNRGLAAGR